MFCIGLYARHTFRKVVPRLLEQETPCRRWQQEKAVQTDRVRPSGLTGASRRRSSSDSGDSLCRIEHEPLEGFCFPQNNRPEAATRSRGSGEIGLEETCITVRADITYEDCKDITVVWVVSKNIFTMWTIKTLPLWKLYVFFKYMTNYSFIVLFYSTVTFTSQI